MKEIKFEVGDRVFDIRYGWGTVIKDDIYPVSVLFDLKNGNKTVKLYTSDGRDMLEDNISMLSFTEYTLQNHSTERPINYEDYIGKWGKFHNHQDGKFDISILEEYGKDNYKGSDIFVSTTGNVYEAFDPLTEKQVTTLKEQKIIN